MSLRVLSSVGSTSANELVYSGVDPTGAFFMDSSGNSSVVPLSINHTYLWGTSSTDKPGFLRTRHVKKQTISHTSTSASSYIINSHGDQFPYIYFNGFFKRVGTAGASSSLLLRCGINNGTIDSGANYQRRVVYNNGTATTVSSATANTGIYAGYVYSYSSVHLTNFMLFEGYGYVKSGAPRVFVIKYHYATSTISNYVVDTTMWMNTSGIMTDLQVIIPASTNALVNVSYWNPA